MMGPLTGRMAVLREVFSDDDRPGQPGSGAMASTGVA